MKPNTLVMGYQFDGVNNGSEDYFLGRLDFPEENAECFVLNGQGEWINICGGILDNDCRWEDINSGTIMGELDMITAFDPEEECYRGKIGIGTNALKIAKLNVLNTLSRDEVLIGIYGESYAWGGDMNSYVIGVSGEGHTNDLCCSSTISVGLQGVGRDSRYAVGVNGLSKGHIGNTTTGVSIAVRGVAEGGSTNTIGIYGEVYSPGNPGYFVGGNVVLTGNTVIISDESVKNTIEPLENASSLLNNLQPKTYFYQSPENRVIGFDQQLQYGFLAQEVNDVIPDIVKETTIPELMDSTGVIEGSSVDLLGVKYTSLIPILVAGFQEQQQKIDTQESAITQLHDLLNQQQEQINQLQEWITNCCTQNESTSPKNNNKNPEKGENQGVILHQNVPNPFSHGTRIEFELPQSANVLVEISDARGVKVITLVRATLDEGPHSYWWDAQDAASGVYFYSLIVDGKLMSKKMIRL